MRKILLTGFMPFCDQEINPSYEAVKKIKDYVESARIYKLEIPVVFKKSLDTVLDAIRKINPDVVILIGQAGGRKDITPEISAINMINANMPDNEGNQPRGVKIRDEGKDLYLSTLPNELIIKNLGLHEIPASLSEDAGTYVCNYLLYGVLHFINTTPSYSRIKCGFIHVPFIEQQIKHNPNHPYMKLEQMTRGLELIIKTSLESI
ncbi:MAG: pyroglutamyl-peptidase I [Acholeplasmataceae bacterium]|nr:pyroglutamyl-peptidase I [Acholeplasmataceae bacterium]